MGEWENTDRLLDFLCAFSFRHSRCLCNFPQRGTLTKAIRVDSKAKSLPRGRLLGVFFNGRRCRGIAVTDEVFKVCSYIRAYISVRCIFHRLFRDIIPYAQGYTHFVRQRLASGNLVARKEVADHRKDGIMYAFVYILRKGENGGKWREI